MKRIIILVVLLLCVSQAQSKIKLTAEPQIGLAYTTAFRFAGGMKFIEVKRYGASFMVTAKEWEYGLSFSRVLTDALPVKSLSVGIYGVNFFEDFRVGAILTVDL